MRTYIRKPHIVVGFEDGITTVNMDFKDHIPVDDLKDIVDAKLIAIAKTIMTSK